MKNRILLLTCLSVTVFSMGCDKQDTTTQQLEKVSAKTETTAQNMKDYTFTQKDEFVASMKSQLDEINRDLDKIAAKLEVSKKDNKAEAQLKLKALRKQNAKLSQKLDEAKNATESTWDDFKAGFKKGFKDVKSGFNDARQWVRDVIEPS